MGFFFRALAAMVVADAIDRHARQQPVKYWHPDPPFLPHPGANTSVAVAPGWYADPNQPCRWRWWDGKRWSAHTYPASGA
jgi:hypothetical protein